MGCGWGAPQNYEPPFIVVTFVRAKRENILGGVFRVWGFIVSGGGWVVAGPKTMNPLKMHVHSFRGFIVSGGGGWVAGGAKTMNDTRS